MVKIAIDAMGAEGGLDIVVNGALKARKKNSSDIVLVGNEQELSRYDLDGISIHNAPEVVSMDEEPISVLKKKKSSIMVAAGLVRENKHRKGGGEKADVLLSPGNTGATVIASVTLRRVYRKPAIAITVPNKNKKYTLLLDCGANYTCDDEDLFYFSFMGSLFHTYLFGDKKPSVGLLTVGKESYKGTDTLKKANFLLEKTDLNYNGFKEGDNLTDGSVDVLVCDGPIGNIVLKTCEGLVNLISSTIKDEFTKNFKRKIVAGILKLDGAFDDIKHRFNPETYGGGFLLGLEKPVIISHGSSSAKSIEHAIYFAERCAGACKQINPKFKEIKKEYTHLFR